ncbi:hypothetical protein Nos7524_4007 [Nostoc sp. PCC 7524]|nr:hypothetical protein Nos7524_4007 [Nostoc sp. PCC 7524]
MRLGINSEAGQMRSTQTCVYTLPAATMRSLLLRLRASKSSAYSNRFAGLRNSTKISIIIANIAKYMYFHHITPN